VDHRGSSGSIGAMMRNVRMMADITLYYPAYGYVPCLYGRAPLQDGRAPQQDGHTLLLLFLWRSWLFLLFTLDRFLFTIIGLHSVVTCKLLA
jgi:hypothetical protein